MNVSIINKAWFWGIALTVILTLAALAQWGQSAERGAFALGHSLAPRHLPNADVVMVGIDPASLAKYGPWPWPRSLLATLTDQLTADKARVIAFMPQLSAAQNQAALDYLGRLAALDDVKGSHPASVLVSQAQTALNTDTALAGSLQSAGNVILAAHVLDPDPAAPMPAPPDWFTAKASVGSGDGSGLVADFFGPLAMKLEAPLASLAQAADGIGFMPPAGTGATPLVVNDGGQWVPSFALLVAARDLGLHNADIVPTTTGGVYLGNEYLFTDARMRTLPHDYSGGEGRSAIPYYSFDAAYSGTLSPDSVSGKTVIIGPTETARGPALQAVANMVSSILNNDLVAAPFWSWGVRGLLTLLVGLYLVVVLPRLNRIVAVVVSALFLILLINIELVPLLTRGLWLPLALPILFLVIGHSLILTLNYLRRRLGAPQEELSETGRQLGIAYQALGRHQDALQQFSRCVPSKTLYDNLLALGHEHERQRRYADALEVYEIMRKRVPEYGSVEDRVQRLKSLDSSAGMARARRGARPMPVIEEGLQKPMLGRYELVRELGHGAMGVVYLGRDQKIGRTVAIKTMPLADEFEGEVLQQVSQRFLREAETAGLLNHPNIITIYDVGEDQGLAYIAMDYLPGEPLQSYVQPDKLLPLDEIMAITSKIAEALAYAHGRQVVHRDIKPANIIYERQTGRMKITDFGVASLINASRTRTGTILGSPSYMSPEQVAGRKVDGRSDIYSLGVTLYQLLRGELPFEAPSLTGLMFKISNEPAPDVTFLRPDIPEGLKEIVDRALQKSPAARFQTGTEMALALRSCLNKTRKVK